MNKIALACACGSAGVAVAAGTYYRTAAFPTDTEVPPIMVNLSVQEVQDRLAPLNVETFALAFGVNPRDVEGLRQVLHSSTARNGNGAQRIVLRFEGDEMLAVSIQPKPVDANRTEVDVGVKVLDNRMSRRPELHPYDLRVVEGAVDLVVTEYVDSVLNRRRMASEKEMEGPLKRLIGLSQRQGQAMAARLELAFKASYESRLRARFDSSDERGPWDSGAAQAYESAADAAESASDAAQQAADAASAAAEAAVR